MATTVAYSGLASFELPTNGSANLLTIPPGSYGTKPLLFYMRGLLQTAGRPGLLSPVLTFTDASTQTLNPTRLVGSAEFNGCLGQSYLLPGTVLDQGATLSVTATATGSGLVYGLLAAVVVSWDSSVIAAPAISGNGFADVTGAESQPPGNLTTSFFPNLHMDDNSVRKVQADTPFLVQSGYVHAAGIAGSNRAQGITTAIWINQSPFDDSYAWGVIADGLNSVDWNALGKPYWSAIAGATGTVTHLAVPLATGGESSIDFGGIPTQGVATATARGWAQVIG